MLNPNEEFHLSETEKKVLEFWKTNQIFEKSLLRRKGKKPYVFYEGPPTANGRPGIHHVLARAFKDIILRYKTMRGFYVPRRAGWDTQGLPVEVGVEKELGIKDKHELEKYGIDRFNQKAKESVWRFKDEWEKLTDRMGYWLDMKNPYVTYESDYIETLWWIIKRFFERKLLYKGHKVVPWCSRCGTSLSSHELAQGYQETKDNSVYVKFKLKKGQKIGKFIVDDQTYILSWTTTPWTLPGNVALAVGEKIKYNATEKDGDELWYASDSPIGKEIGHIGKEVSGKDLIGLEYEPLFDISSLRTKTAYKIYPADFVTTTDGTGVVHTAVMYGEDDYQLGRKVGLPEFHTVNEDGKFIREVPGLAGLPVKAKETEQKIFAELQKNKNLLKIEPCVHEYPFCWRCGTPILYYARGSWFVKMSSLRDKLLAANKKMAWVPAHLKEGRFGEWLKDAKDWNFSRERYWGTPLPIWECKKCGETEVIGGYGELNKRLSGARNNYFVMRHGQSVNNAKNLIDSGNGKYDLTLLGRKQAEIAAKKLKKELSKKKEKIDLIIHSNILRASETAEIAAEVLGAEAKNILAEPGLKEIQLGALSGCRSEEYHKLYPTLEEKFERVPENGESLRMLRERVWKVLEKLEKKYKGKNILLVSHEYPIWMLFHAALGWSERQAVKEKLKYGDDFINTGEIRQMGLMNVPRNVSGEIDPHRPFVDTLAFACKKCSGEMKRVKEIADVWFDSGAMPWAEDHFPFAQIKEPLNALAEAKLINKISYPADYISEAVDQTRGWFYTLLAVATALGFEGPFKNVVCLGHINDKNGQKMSKSKGNIVDPWMVFDKYGADAVRWYFYTVNPPGEPKNFDETELLKSYRRFHLLYYNSFVFFATYGKKISGKTITSGNILDKWILLRLNETVLGMEKYLDEYNIREAALILEAFVDDLSRWYIRRSRRRLQKPETQKDFAAASVTLYTALLTATKLAAPFMPFMSEAIYSNLNSQKSDSVHFADWPKAKKITNAKLLSQMKEVRNLASLGLAERANAGIKVRQPLQTLWISASSWKLINNKELLQILKEEVNVKTISAKKDLKEGVLLDKNITAELKEEGNLREVTRAVQELRQDAKLKPADKIILFLELPEQFGAVAKKNEAFIKKEVGASSVEYKRTEKFDAEILTKLDGAEAHFALKKL